MGKKLITFGELWCILGENISEIVKETDSSITVRFVKGEIWDDSKEKRETSK